MPESVEELAAAVRRRHPWPARIERQLRQSVQLGGGDWTSLFTEPVAIVVYICMAALLLTPLILRLLHRQEPDPIHIRSEETEEKASA